MNVCFHYCAVKYMASCCGFNEEESQKIAAYSQLMDDSTYDSEVLIEESRLRADVKERKLVDIDEGNVMCKVYIPQTTVPACRDMESEAKWKEVVMNQIVQKYCLVPFHYCPPKPVTDNIIFSEVSSDKALAGEIMKPESHAIFSILMNQAKEAYSKSDKGEFLIRAGVLSHILADSFSHCMYSGVCHEANKVKLIEIRDCQSKEDLINRYDTVKLGNMPNVGHLQAGSAPDDSGIMGNLLREGIYGYTFHNRQNVKNAARQIMRMFFLIRNKEIDSGRTALINNTIAVLDMLFDSAAVDFSNQDCMKLLYRKWKEKTGLNYEYSKHALLNRMKGEEGGLEELFDFIIVTDDVQREVLADYGKDS